MFRSILEDIKMQYRSGHWITRLIMLNIGIWAVMALIKSFTPAGSTFYTTLVEYLAIPGDPLKLLFRPWTIVTHMFIHDGFWHVAMNMLYLYFFGRVVGDLIGDRHILPVYFAGGLAGALAYVVAYQFMPGYIGLYALGASAAVSALVLASGLLAPDYEMRLILIGSVRLKFIVLAVLIFYLIGLGGTNRGGHIAHLAGMAMGWYFVYQMGRDRDITARFHGLFDWLSRLMGGSSAAPTSRRGNMKVSYKSPEFAAKSSAPAPDELQEQVDLILEKIKATGYDSLSKTEKDILYKASKK